MRGKGIGRRQLLRSLAALPLSAAFFGPREAKAETRKIVVFTGIEPPRGGIYNHVFGWAAETPEGWIGRVFFAHIAVAERDLPGFAEGATARCAGLVLIR